MLLLINNKPLRDVKLETCCKIELDPSLKVLQYTYLCQLFHKTPHSTTQGYQLSQPSMKGYKQGFSQLPQQTSQVPKAITKAQ